MNLWKLEEKDAAREAVRESKSSVNAALKS